MGHVRSRILNSLPPRLLSVGQRVARRIRQWRNWVDSRNRPGVVVMLHVGRCGSTVLGGMLAQNPRIFWDGKTPRKLIGLYGKRAARVDFGRWAQRQFLVAGDRYYGFEFKILRDQYPALLRTTANDFLRLCRSIGVTHYVVLRRRNTLRHVVSHYASMARGNWHRASGEGITTRSFVLDVHHVTTGSSPGRPLLEYMREVEDAYNDVVESLKDGKVLQLEYESDIATSGADVAYRKVCDFLQVPAVPVPVPYERANASTLAQSLENHEEVAKAVVGTRFEWMMEESGA